MNSHWFLFGNIKDYFWKLILGIGSVITALELFTNKIDDIFNVNFEYGTYIFLFLYFLVPILLFSFWWWSKLTKSLPSSFDEKDLIQDTQIIPVSLLKWSVLKKGV